MFSPGTSNLNFIGEGESFRGVIQSKVSEGRYSSSGFGPF